ncbi:hypothetical protein [uncultured Cohaesibacter sp.]|uniref:hypothetical protein n=1 Tax=uncultured Cohaesibacter sp. TaxID=1002546 RepID=UPI002AA9138D|nr:hypothetical protein [uncultured Cohaesibacter sp.]
MTKMSTDLLVLDSLVDDIAAFAKKQIDYGDLSGPRFGAYVKLAWCTQSGTPCYSDCQNIADALQTLRNLEQNEQVDSFYVAMTAICMEAFPQVNTSPSDFDAIRRMGAALREVA